MGNSFSRRWHESPGVLFRQMLKSQRYKYSGAVVREDKQYMLYNIFLWTYFPHWQLIYFINASLNFLVQCFVKFWSVLSISIFFFSNETTKVKFLGIADAVQTFSVFPEELFTFAKRNFEPGVINMQYYCLQRWYNSLGRAVLFPVKYKFFSGSAEQLFQVWFINIQDIVIKLTYLWHNEKTYSKMSYYKIFMLNYYILPLVKL